MPEKTEDELRAIKALIDEDTAYGDFPDGVTWADWQAATELEDSDAV